VHEGAKGQCDRTLGGRPRQGLPRPSGALRARAGRALRHVVALTPARCLASYWRITPRTYHQLLSERTSQAACCGCSGRRRRIRRTSWPRRGCLESATPCTG
jgi:hypothetical protein